MLSASRRPTPVASPAMTTTPGSLSSIEILAGTPPGGGQDRAARALAAALVSSAGVEVAVSNVVGRGGGVAWSSLRDRDPGPAVVSISSPTLLTNHLVDPTEPGIGDLTHLALLCSEPLAFATRPGGEIDSPERLLGWLAAADGTIAIATALGNVNHLAVLDVVSHAGGLRSPRVEAFDSAVRAIEALDGHADLAVVSAASATARLAAGTLDVVALSAPGRPAGPLMGIPTWTEIGVPCERSTWRGLVGGPGLDRDDVDAWSTLVEAATASDAWAEAVERHLWVPRLLIGEAAATFAAVEASALEAGWKHMETTGG